jgi:hypothetical protein
MENTNNLDLTWYNNVKELEREWKCESWQRWSERKWLEAFPEAKEIIPQKIKEWEEMALDALCDCIKRRREIRSEVKNEFSLWFWLEWVKWNEGKRLLDTCIQLDRLSGLVHSQKPLNPSFDRFSEALERAKTADIVELASTYLPKLRRFGKTYCANCVFHEEKNPSLFLYPETSSYHCFGCQAHGDTISLLMKLENIDFKEAVRQLGGI